MLKVKRLKKNQQVKIIRSFETAIKKNCYDCMGHQKYVDCELDTCPLYLFRPWAGWAAKSKSKKDD